MRSAQRGLRSGGHRKPNRPIVLQSEMPPTPLKSRGAEDKASSLDFGVAKDGYQLTGVAAPLEVGTDDGLSLTVTGPAGRPVTGFQLKHEKALHLIVVRVDGRHFRHVHPTMDAEGTRSIHD